MRKLGISFILAMAITAPAAAENILVNVNGLVCAFCVHGIEATFKKQPEVDSVTVDLDAKTVAVVTKPDATLDDAAVNHLITEAGYTPVSICRVPGTAPDQPPAELQCTQIQTAS